MQWDNSERLTKFQEPDGVTVAYEYDIMGNLTREKMPIAGTSYSYSYDSVGRLSRAFRPDSTTVDFNYDSLNRLTKADYSAGTDISLSYSGAGDITRVTGPGPELQYGYEHNRVTKEHWPSTGAAAWRTFDGRGRVATAKTPGAVGMEGVVPNIYSYDPHGRLTRVSHVFGGIIDYSLATFAYDEASGRLTKRTSYDFDSGIKHLEASYTFKNNGWLASVTHQGFNASGAAGDSILQAYSYDDIGNVTRVQATDSDGRNNENAYGYDPVGRLTLEKYAFNNNVEYHQWQYLYDAAGNSTKVVYDDSDEAQNDYTTTYGYDANRRLTKSTKNGVDTTYGFDANGNLTKKAVGGGDTWEYQWSLQNRMTKVRKQPSGGAWADVASYTYDALGRRFQKTAGGATTTYYQDGLTPVVEATATQRKMHRSVPGALGNVIQTDDGTNNAF